MQLLFQLYEENSCSWCVSCRKKNCQPLHNKNFILLKNFAVLRPQHTTTWLMMRTLQSAFDMVRIMPAGCKHSIKKFIKTRQKHDEHEWKIELINWHSALFDFIWYVLAFLIASSPTALFLFSTRRMNRDLATLMLENK